MSSSPSEIAPQEAERLLKLDSTLREESDRFLSASGIGAVLRREGFAPVGSYDMHTMTWRDLDFERVQDPPDWRAHWELGKELAELDWVWKFYCTHAYRQPESADEGLYWGLRASDPAGGPVWKVDLWTARAQEFEAGSPDRARWSNLLTEECRVRILAIKEAVCNTPEYRNTILSVHIYKAVIDDGVHGTEEFRRWHKSKAG